MTDKQSGNSPNQIPAPLTILTTPNSKASSKKEDGVNGNGDLFENKKDSPVDDEDVIVTLKKRLPSRPAAPKGKKGAARHDQALASPTLESSDSAPARLLPEETPSTSGPSSTINAADLHPGALAHLTPGLGLSPTLTGILWPFNTDDLVQFAYSDFTRSNWLHLPSTILRGV